MKTNKILIAILLVLFLFEISVLCQQYHMKKYVNFSNIVSQNLFNVDIQYLVLKIKLEKFNEAGISLNSLFKEYLNLLKRILVVCLDVCLLIESQLE